MKDVPMIFFTIKATLRKERKKNKLHLPNQAEPLFWQYVLLIRRNAEIPAFSYIMGVDYECFQAHGALL